MTIEDPGLAHYLAEAYAPIVARLAKEHGVTVVCATATAVGNAVKEVGDIEHGLKLAKKIRGLDGVLIIKDDQLGALGKVKIVPL